MATMARQPFAPLDGARLQALTSTKNRQNAVQTPASKRKACAWNESEDAENVDPHLSAKRSKGVDGSNAGGLLKKPAFTPTKASLGSLGSLSSVANIFDAKPVSASPLSTSSTPRAVLKPRAPSTKLSAKRSHTSPIRSSPISTSSLPSTPSFASLAGRSPIRASRRGGLLTSKRRAVDRASSSFSSNVGSAAPFSLDAALKGTLASFDARLASSALPTSSLLDETTGMNAAWEFVIHEDTPEQEMTNLLQHSTCVLDISSDEESEQKARRERAEGRDKENIPPPNDVSQTSVSRAAPTAANDEMCIDKARNPLSQLNAADFYADGCDEASVVLVEEEVEQSQAPGAPEEQLSLDAVVDAAVQAEIVEAAQVEEAAEAIETTETTDAAVEDIMSNRESPAGAAALLEPIEGTGESFQLWESGSQKDEDL